MADQLSSAIGRVALAIASAGVLEDVQGTLEVGLAKRKTVRHFHEAGHLHERTFSCYRREPLLTSDLACDHLAEAVDISNLGNLVELVAFVFMPEHVHLLNRPLDDLPNLGRYLAMVKRATSGSHRESLTRDDPPLLESPLLQERTGKVCSRFWQVGAGYDRNLWTPGAIHASINDIHGNQVKRGLCQRTIDWKWSSARYDHAVLLGQPYAGLPRVHGLELE